MAGRARRASTLAFVLLLVCQAAGEKPELRWLSNHSPSTHSPKHGPSSPHHSVPEASATSAQPEAVSFLGRVTSFVTRRMKNPYVMAVLYALITKDPGVVIATAVFSIPWYLGIMAGSKAVSFLNRVTSFVTRRMKNPYVMAALYALVTKDLSFVIAMAIWRLSVMFASWTLTMQRGDVLARSENQFRMYMQKLEEEEERYMQKLEEEEERSRKKHEAYMQRLEEERNAEMEEEAIRSRQKHEAYMQRLEEERKAEMDRLNAHNVEPGRAQGSALNEAREQAAQKRHDQAMTSAIDPFKAAQADQQRQYEADQNRLWS